MPALRHLRRAPCGFRRASTLQALAATGAILAAEPFCSGGRGVSGQAPTARLICGDALSVLRASPPEWADAVVTSPPYWRLRDYGIRPTKWADGAVCCLGLEETVDAYIDHLVELLAEVRRVLRPHGTLWLNLGDVYGGGARGEMGASSTLSGTLGHQRASRAGEANGARKGVPPLGLAGVPWRAALALAADGWLLRSEVVWHKPCPVPESLAGWSWERCKRRVSLGARSKTGSGTAHANARFAKRNCEFEHSETALCDGCEACRPNDGYVLRRANWRPTRAHEHVFLLASGSPYYCDGEALRTVASPKTATVRTSPTKGRPGDSAGETLNSWYLSRGVRLAATSANARSVWSVAPEPLKGAHFAAFPSALAERCIAAATPAAGCCSVCGAPWAQVVEIQTPTGRSWTDHANDLVHGKRAHAASRSFHGGRYLLTGSYTREVGEWLSTCGCSAPPRSAIVLDPFAGTASTGVAALRLGRSFVGIDASPRYLLRIARNRLAEVSLVERQRRPRQLRSSHGPLFAASEQRQ